jgi:tetratricopeptide (TPR) repeat protein
MGLKIAYLLIIATPLVGVVIVFVIPFLFGGDPSENHFKAGLDWHEKGRFQNAIDEYDQAIELNQDFVQACVKRADAWLAMGDWAKALWDYDDVINREDQLVLKLATREYHSYKSALANAYFGRAVIYDAQGYSVKANSDADKAEELGYDPAVISAAFMPPVP